jgi:hypothetical protein
LDGIIISLNLLQVSPEWTELTALNLFHSV